MNPLIATPKQAGTFRIAVDAMGGDKGPLEVLQGVRQAARQSASQFLLVGDPAILETELRRSPQAHIELIPAADVITMDESPVKAFRRKPNASVVVGARLVKEGRADALVTIGNTGAAMTVAHLTWERIPGIDRAAIATPMPSLKGVVVLIDGGATVDCDPNNLYEFAIMGSVYAQAVLGVAAPKVGLLSNGEEPTKGNDVVKRAHALFRESEGKAFDFYGNVEGRDIFRGTTEVIVCDGFVGNIALKSGEGVAEMMLEMLRLELGAAWMKPFVAALRPALRRVRSRIDYAEFGGAPLLGVNGICIIGHGRSDASAVTNACHAAERAVQHNLIEAIRQRVCNA